MDEPTTGLTRFPVRTKCPRVFAHGTYSCPKSSMAL